MKNKDILIIEDDKAITRILELEFMHEGYTYDIAFDGKEGLEKFQTGQYGIILLDLMLPEISGMEVCRKVRKGSDIPIIMMTARRDITDKVIGLDLGADDYVTKPFEMEELLARIRVGLRRSKAKTGEQKILELADLSINLLTREVIKQGDCIELTKTEYDLLEYLLRNKGLVLTRDQILEHVWGYDFVGDSNVLDVYIRYLRNKIDYPYETKFIHTVRGVGYSLKE
ncbi:response regulator transcription factor [Parasporobacterium paucivorans]|uniref:Stage 0 sporulation protein A homolog n=1 Tax=Parasporobacterium paucivorans DSM 15970 TaxID=1122934 RepID=A0A1M6D2C2_9FIRM|nr:response regulator transcription factor [Parasporobacterium paucivorans]SHI67263.1 DNA-binding response regulator, OmpR family, contains REC and winged-helix (wHTH) domain [Parasporobacterium paucivorans DSM 15970]